MKSMRWLGLVLGLSLVLAFVGCAKPPEAEQQAAKAAMDAAVAAGADKYAAADLNAAKKAWEGAEAQMKEKKYKEAKQAYIDAKAAFEKAAGAVEAGKKAAAAEATAAVAALEESWKKMEEAAKKWEKKMKDAKDAWAADVAAVGEGLGKAKEAIAADPAGVKPKIEEIKGVVAKWEAKFQEMAAAPAKPEAPKKK